MAVTDALDAAKNRVSAMLEPISGGVGADCTYDELFEAIKAEIDKTTSIEGGKIDWNKIVTNAEELLTDKTKDFRLGVYYAAAKAHTGGLTGVLDGLVLLNELNSAFWDKMYPPIKRPRTRGNLTQFLGDQLAVTVQGFTPTAKDADLVGAVEKASRDLDGELRDKLADAYGGLGGLRDSCRRLVASVPKEAPPPPPPPRSWRSWASFTRTARPSTSTPSIAWMAAAASSSVAISTKAKPRERPVSRSVMMRQLATWRPSRSKCSVRVSSVVS